MRVRSTPGSGGILCVWLAALMACTTSPGMPVSAASCRSWRASMRPAPLVLLRLRRDRPGTAGGRALLPAAAAPEDSARCDAARMLVPVLPRCLHAGTPR
jgi:hypothetical protein